MAIRRNVANSASTSQISSAPEGVEELLPVAPTPVKTLRKRASANIPEPQGVTGCDDRPESLLRNMVGRLKTRLPQLRAIPGRSNRQSAPEAQDEELRSPGAGNEAPPVQTTRAAEKNHAEMVTPIRPVNQEKGGWFSPTYMNSRTVKLNPQVLEENRCVGFKHEAEELEYYRVLRTHILQQTGGKGNTIMVTSACPGEGKTLTAINLAFTFAREYKQTALLVDCDLGRQQIHERLGFPGDKGLVDFLIDDADLSSLMVWPGVEKLTVISGGKTVNDRSELLGSLGMKNLVQDMKTRYPDRYVFFDVPPLLTCADALTFAPLVDYVLVVVRAGQTSLKDVNRALKLLPAEKILGLVMNRQQDLL